MTTITELLAASPAFAGLSAGDLERVAACASERREPAGSRLFRQGDPADRFFVVRHGAVALELHPPSGPTLVIETLHGGEIVGWSWLFAPHRWAFDGRTVDETELVVFDGERMLELCDADHELGRELMGRFAACLVERLQATRLQLLDVYGHARAS